MSAAEASPQGPGALRAARPASALPPGRLSSHLQTDPLLLHTFVGPRAYDRLVHEGRLRADPDRVDPELRQAYDWMRGQARRRVPGARGRYPVWLWAHTTRRALLDQATAAAREQPGTVLLTCRIPATRCLLSHFEEWHSVLNVGVCVPWVGRGEPDRGRALAAYLRRLDEEQEAIDDGLAAVGLTTADPIAEWPPPVRSRIEAGWELIFDRSRYGRYDRWQATVEQLDAAEVLDAVVLT